MASAPINPTQITPPRVAFFDERTGAISREWYRFLLSLRDSSLDSQDVLVAPNAQSLLASYDALLADLAQGVQTAPDAASGLASAAAALSDLAQTAGSTPPPATTESVAALADQLQALAITPPPREYRAPRYGSFYDTTTQTAAVVNTAYPITFNTTDLSLGVTVGSPTSRIYVDRPNVYNVQFSAQLDKTAGGVGLVWIWLRKNGVNVADSAGQIRIQGNNAEILAAWNYVIQLNAGDYIELMWEVDDTSVILLADPASAVHPSVPSVILTVTDNISSMEV
jgi:hypothetical protein